MGYGFRFIPAPFNVRERVMAIDTMMFKVGEAQAAQLPMLTGKSFTVGKTVSAGNGLGSYMFLHPAGGTAGKGMVALKVSGAAKSGTIASLTGKTVMIGQSPLGMAGTGHWLVLHTGGQAAVAAKGAGAVGAAAIGTKKSAAVATKSIATAKAGAGKAATSAASASKGGAVSKGLGSLGLGLGLGTGGTIALFGALFVVGVGVHSYMSRDKIEAEAAAA